MLDHVLRVVPLQFSSKVLWPLLQSFFDVYIEFFAYDIVNSLHNLIIIKGKLPIRNRRFLIMSCSFK
jgi:hypothetical protein